MQTSLKEGGNINNCLITGGAGFLGINLVRYLLAKGCSVRIFDIAKFDYPEKNQVEVIKGDIRDYQTLAEATQNINIVVHAAAALPLYKKEDIYSTDVEGTKNVLEAAYQSKVERLIHISSTAVYGITDHHPLKEDDDLIGVGPYGEAKIMAEEVCLDYRKKGLCVSILRPKSFIGPERLGVFALFYDWAKDGKSFPLPGKGENKYQLLDVEDLCEAIWLTMIKKENIVNDIFNIGAKEYVTMKEDFQAVLDYAGYGKSIVSLPIGPLVWSLRILEALRLSPLYKWVYETAFKDSYVSIDKAETLLGFRAKYSNKEALLRNFQWYLDNLNEFENTSGVSHRAPWKQGVLSFAKRFF
jgi:nucleoside-diphosphate-sugar epimerase